MIIPNEIEAYGEGTRPDKRLEMDEDTIYYPIPNEKVNVVMWSSYPSYDFIFGVPDPSSKFHEKEICSFTFRDSRSKNKHQFFFDIEEVEQIIEGLKLVYEEYKVNSPHLWKNRKPIDWEI